ncbi:conserved hypothetical protein [Ricinus communis]|uniref:Uncharacterized protein n=1 Tax=Ricinus communis TaxID=3988 RepID=B9RYF9_RICCO|nr:conserved hypothetical protein [Ricinus communis]
MLRKLALAVVLMDCQSSNRVDDILNMPHLIETNFTLYELDNLKRGAAVRYKLQQE